MPDEIPPESPAIPSLPMPDAFAYAHPGADGDAFPYSECHRLPAGLAHCRSPPASSVLWKLHSSSSAH